MLAYLHVKNIALIEELEVDFDNGLNILTGETGAGKSIILGSINYVLGAKVKKDFIRTGAQEAFVECIFDLKNAKYDQQTIVDVLDQCGITYSHEELIISRKTALNGRSVFRVNGEVVRQDIIIELATILIDIHSQHEHQSLLSSNRQLDLLDRFAGTKMDQLLASYYNVYKELQHLKQSINEELLDDDKRRREIAFLEFEIDEITKANLTPDEDVHLQKTYDRLSHSKLILEKLSKINSDLYGDIDVSGIVSSAIGDMHKLLQYDDELIPVNENLIQIEELLLLIKRDMNRYIDGMEDFDEDFYYTGQRLDQINKLKVKYGDTINDVLVYLEEKELEHSSLVDFEKNLMKTKQDIKKASDQLTLIGKEIHEYRQVKAKELAKAITLALKDLNLSNALFQVSVTEQEDYSSKGFDKVNFLITTNKGEAVKPLKDVASGGELSRVMLAIKTILASVDGVDTLVFDEIDTGISGHTAQKVAEKMLTLSKDRQLICITHLPQIAAMANQHYLIQKKVIKDTTQTFVEKLNEVDAINELARMLSGAVTSDITIANAREMKAFAKIKN